MDSAPAPRAAEPGRTHDRRRVQTALKLSDPGDAAEREAVATARAVVQMRNPVLPARAQVPMLAARAPSAAPAASKAKKDEVSPELTAEIKSLAGSGRPLSPDTRSFLEPRFKANFAGVRVHTGGKAENLATRLGARAFTYGKDIFFNAGAFKPNTPEGMELIAHELTHTIQQREVVQRDVIQREEAVTVQQRTGPQVQRGIVSEALDWIADKANVIPGFRLFTIVIGRNPINMSKVDRSGANILRALIEFIPGGGLIVQALENHGIFEKGGKFIEDQFAALRDLGGAVRDALMEFVNKLGARDIFRLGSLWDRAKRIFTAPIDKAIAFGKGLVSGIAELVKEAIIKPLGRWAANNIPKWNLLVGVFGKNPISDEGESPASALIGAFMELIGQKEIWENIKKGNAVAKAWAWFQGAMKGALSLVTSIPGRVMSTIRSLTIFDIVTLVGAFQKIVGAFSSFVGDFMGWAGGTVLQLLEIILSVVAPSVIPYLKKAGGAFSSIIKNPVGFVRTLVRAGIQGFRQFAGNFLAHLKAALIGWLTGSLGGLGIYIPSGFTLIEILKFVLSVMGLTWANVRAKLVAATNETVVKALETGFDIVRTLVTEGPAAAWQKIVETLTNLKQMAIDAVMDFVKSKVVEAAVTKLLSMLSPAGAFIQAIIAIYNTIMFFVERIRQIAAVAASFIDGIAAIAAGNIAPAANRVERTMAGLLVLVISFLARIAGLGKVSDAITGLVKKIRAPIDKALDKVVAWIVASARKLGKFVAQAGVPQDPAARLRLASGAAVAAAKTLRGKVTAPLLNAAFGLIKTRYALTSIDAFDRGGQWFARIKINPDVVTPLEVAGESGADDPAAKAVLALIAAGTKIFDIVPKARAKLVYTKPIDGYILDAGSDSEGPSIKRANRPKGKAPLPAVHIDRNGVIAEGAKVHQKRSSEAEKLAMYRDVMIKLGLGNLMPHVTEANVNAASNSEVRGAMRTAILDSPKYQTLSAFNQMISTGALTGPGMQGELFEAWIVKRFGSSQGISDSKIKYKTASGVGLMDRSAGDKIVEIKSRVRPSDVKQDVADDDIPQTKFVIAGKDSEQFTRYNEILGGSVEMITKSSGTFVVPSAFSGARYYFNFRGVAKLFNARMPEPLRSKTVFYLGGSVIAV